MKVSDILGSELFGRNMREFCLQSERAFFFRNLKPRLFIVQSSWKEIAPKRITVPQYREVYRKKVTECDEILNTFQYGLQFIDKLIVECDEEAMNRWWEVMKKLQNLCDFLESEEAYLKTQCCRPWNGGIYNCKSGDSFYKEAMYPIVAARLTRESWYTVATNPTVTVHAITKEIVCSLKENVAGLLYEMKPENLMVMSTGSGDYQVSERSNLENPFTFQLPKMEELFLASEINKYYDMDFRITEDFVFLPPETFVSRAKEVAGKNDFGLGKILLKNNVEDLYGIFYSEGSTQEFKDKVKLFSQVFGISVYEAKKDGFMVQLYKSDKLYF